MKKKWCRSVYGLFCLLRRRKRKRNIKCKNIHPNKRKKMYDSRLMILNLEFEPKNICYFWVRK